MKRILLFVATNLAVMITLSIVLGLLGFTGYITPSGLDYSALMVFCLVWGMGGAFISLAMSRFMAKMAMGVQLVNGRTGQAELDWLYRTVEQLTQKAGLPMPEVGIYDSGEVNAFATGPSKSRSLVAVSTGLLSAMRHDEIEGVLAHEVSHIRNGDMVTMTLIQGVVNAFVMFFARIIANIVRQMVDEKISHIVFFVVALVLDIALGVLGMMVVAWFSRAREFRADAGGAALAGKPSMIGALQRLMQNKTLVDTTQPQLATMKIAGGKGFMALVSTHPPLEDRIAALQKG
ncbi:MAG: zinc metalloprotease HtpX [Acidobacteria bacterium RIFCSPLOWO2_12_FULL_67_14b]|nr:MAG: zinc metalloprotease HtpX [Acidobacteria bacterium RIFCSPLOWO2_12_FULL_67_14b]